MGSGVRKNEDSYSYYTGIFALEKSVVTPKDTVVSHCFPKNLNIGFFGLILFESYGYKVWCFSLSIVPSKQHLTPPYKRDIHDRLGNLEREVVELKKLITVLQRE